MTNASTQDGYRGLALGAARYLGAQSFVAVSTLLALWVAGHWGTGPVDMLYLPAVLAAGVWWGFGPAILAGLSSALAYNYYFTEPLHTFRINSMVDIVDVMVLFLVAVVTSQLAAAIREQAQIAEAHATRNSTIAGFARRLLSCPGETEIAQTACEEISTIFDCNAVVLSGLPQPTTIATAPNVIALTPTDIAAAVYTLQSGAVAGHGSVGVAPAEWLFHPIRSDASVLAALGLSRDDGSRPVSEEQEALLKSLLDQTALALTRARGSKLPPSNRAAAR